MGDGNEGMLDNKNLYNDKELFDDGDLDWYDYGFRSYDPQIGRFMQMNPLTDDYPELTPYQYASCDPITNIDLDGLEGVDAVVTAASNMQEVVVVATRAASTASHGSSFVNSLAKGALQFVEHVGAFSLGVANAWGSDQVLGAGLYDAPEHGLTDSKGVAFQIGQKVGHGLAILSGGSEMGGGGAAELVTGGAATPLAVPVAAHGLSAASLGLYHLLL